MCQVSVLLHMEVVPDILLRRAKRMSVSGVMPWGRSALVLEQK